MRFVKNAGTEDSVIAAGFDELDNEVPATGDSMSDLHKQRDSSGFYGPSNIPPNRQQKKIFSDNG